jgi:hypothetical protein
LALVETGCSLALLFDQATARELGVVETPKLRRQNKSDSITLADGSSVDIQFGYISIVWNSVPRRLAVGIVPNGPLFPDEGSWAGTEPKALIGCQLLATNTLTINFCRKSVEISDCTAAV